MGRPDRDGYRRECGRRVQNCLQWFKFDMNGLKGFVRNFGAFCGEGSQDWRRQPDALCWRALSKSSFTPVFPLSQDERMRLPPFENKGISEQRWLRPFGQQE